MKVAIIDDHRLIRKGIKELLSTDPSLEIVGEAPTFDDAEKLLITSQPDIAILDFRLGEKYGLDLLSEKESLYPTTKFLVYSMYRAPAIVKSSFDKGASGFVTKSAPEEELLTAIKKIAGGELYGEKGLSESVDNLNDKFTYLTERERTVFTKIQMHESNVQIADELNVNLKTIENYIYRICDKTGLPDRAAIERME